MLMFENERVELKGGLIFLQLFIADPEVFDWVSKVEEGERVDAVKRALKIGVTAMTSALVGSTNFMIRQALELWKAEMERALSEGRERIVQSIADSFGSGVTQPVKEKIEEATRFVEDRIKEQIERLERRMDPSNPGSWLNVVQEVVNTVRGEFDPERENSYLWRVRKTLSEFYGHDGEAIQRIRESFRQTVEPIQLIVEQIRENLIRVMERLGGIVLEKGIAFERGSVGELLYRATSVTGDTCENVGRDFKSGDWLIKVYDKKGLNRRLIGKIVIEVKDTERGRKAIDDDINSAIVQRGADIGILIFARIEQNPYGLPFVILDEDCSRMVCVWDKEGLNLNFAYQLARIKIREKHYRSESQVDWEGLRKGVREVVSEVERIDGIIDKARLAKERAREAENLSQEIKRNLIRKLQILEDGIMSQIK